MLGGSGGTGYECAKAYISEGAREVVAANNATSENEVVSELGAGHPGITGNISVASDVLPS